jgi:hypothetical protein
VERVVARVTPDRSSPAEAVFRSDVEFEGVLTAEQRAKLSGGGRVSGAADPDAGDSVRRRAVTRTTS